MGRVSAVARCPSAPSRRGCAGVCVSIGRRPRGAVHPRRRARVGAGAALADRPVDLRRAFKQLAPS
eukprot:2561369-Pyramimonas_sp.AAC.1